MAENPHQKSRFLRHRDSVNCKIEKSQISEEYKWVNSFLDIVSCRHDAVRGAGCSVLLMFEQTAGCKFCWISLCKTKTLNKQPRE